MFFELNILTPKIIKWIHQVRNETYDVFSVDGSVVFSKMYILQSNNKVKVAKAEHNNQLKYKGSTALIYQRKLILGYVFVD